VLLSAAMIEIESISVSEIADYSWYASPTASAVMQTVFGFGQAPDYEVPLFSEAALRWWDGTVRHIAAALDVEIDEMRTTHDVALMDQDLETDIGLMRKGTIGAVRFQIQGIIAGEPRIVMQHVNYMNLDSAPTWPRRRGNKPVGYAIEISGTPSISCEYEFSPGLMGTAMQAVNAIPQVCRAPEGMVDVFDIWPPEPRGLRFPR
jgi:4-hydroxy-tetrahydrodipicolinate reductase